MKLGTPVVVDQTGRLNRWHTQLGAVWPRSPFDDAVVFAAQCASLHAVMMSLMLSEPPL